MANQIKLEIPLYNFHKNEKGFIESRVDSFHESKAIPLIRALRVFADEARNPAIKTHFSFDGQIPDKDDPWQTPGNWVHECYRLVTKGHNGEVLDVAITNEVDFKRGIGGEKAVAELYELTKDVEGLRFTDTRGYTHDYNFLRNHLKNLIVTFGETAVFLVNKLSYDAVRVSIVPNDSSKTIAHITLHAPIE